MRYDVYLERPGASWDDPLRWEFVESFDSYSEASSYANRLKAQRTAIRPVEQPECSICRRRHSLEVIHACE